MNPLRALLVSLSRVPPAIMLVVIVGLAVVTTVVVTNQLSRTEQDYRIKSKEMEERINATTKVVYAVKDISEGQAIPADALELKAIPRGQAPADALASEALAIGRIAKFGIAAGQIVSLRDLRLQGKPAGFESRIKSGMRAVTFGVDSNSGVAGFIAPESRIDIMSMVGSGAETKVAAVLSDVEVIAVGQTYEKSAGGTASAAASSVTVAVSPEDTQKLIKAIAASKLYLALRSGNDRVPVPTVDVTSLYAKPAARTSEMAAAPDVSVPAPPNLGGAEIRALKPAAGAEIAPPVTREIEMWIGNKKEIVSLLTR